MYQTPGNLSPAGSLPGGRLRPATRGDIAGWKAEARGTITATQDEIEYCWEEAK